MIKPLRNNILIQIHQIDQSAMMLVDEREAQIEKATVLDVGEDVSLVQKGDVIYFKDYETDTILDGAEKYVIITEEAIKALCITTPSK